MKLSSSLPVVTFASIASAWEQPQYTSNGSFLGHLKPLPSPNGHVVGQGFMHFPVKKVNGSRDAHVHARRWGRYMPKRQASDALSNPAYGDFYIATVSIGTPAQTLDVTIDTGSSELWVNPSCSSSTFPSYCQSLPVYNPASSSTGKDLGSSKTLTYGMGSAVVEYFSESVSVVGRALSQVQFGVASSSQSLYAGIMGISFGIGLTGYYNIIDQLYMQKVTASRAFGLYLGDASATTGGSLIFGGIDTMKYHGSLAKVPIIPYTQAPDGYPRYWISCSAFGLKLPQGYATISTTPTSLILDSGSTFSYWPASLVAGFLQFFSGVVDQGNGLYSVPCSYYTTAKSGLVTFVIGGQGFTVPLAQFIWFNGQTCYFGAIAIPAGSSTPAVLGDTFLRAVYAVFDQDNMNVWLGTAANCGTNVIPIGSGTTAVPTVTGGCALPAAQTCC